MTMHCTVRPLYNGQWPLRLISGCNGAVATSLSLKYIYMSMHCTVRPLYNGQWPIRLISGCNGAWLLYRDASVWSGAA